MPSVYQDLNVAHYHKVREMEQARLSRQNVERQLRLTRAGMPTQVGARAGCASQSHADFQHQLLIGDVAQAARGAAARGLGGGLGLGGGGVDDVELAGVGSVAGGHPGLDRNHMLDYVAA